MENLEKHISETTTEQLHEELVLLREQKEALESKIVALEELRIKLKESPRGTNILDPKFKDLGTNDQIEEAEQRLDAVEARAREIETEIDDRASLQRNVSL